MPRNMSFFLTQDQIREGSKTVTRRNGWGFIKAGDIVNACVKCQGLKKGEKIEKIRQIKIISSTWEPLSAITHEDVRKEGFPTFGPRDFIDLYCKHNKVTPEALVNRIEFEYMYSETETYREAHRRLNKELNKTKYNTHHFREISQEIQKIRKELRKGKPMVCQIPGTPVFVLGVLDDLKLDLLHGNDLSDQVKDILDEIK